MKKRIVSGVLLLSLVLGFSGAMAHTPVQTGHSNCEGAFGFDHQIRYDGVFAGVGWYHSLSRYINTNGDYTALKRHYKGTITGPVYSHQTFVNTCGEGPS